MVRIAIFLAVLVLIDLYAFQAFRVVTKKCSSAIVRWLNVFYWSASIFCFSIIILAQFTDWRNWNKYFRTYSIAILLILILSKVVLDFFVLTGDVVRFFRWSAIKFSSWFQKTEFKKPASQTLTIPRSEFIIKMGLFVASIPFFSLIYGMTFNAYNYRTRRLKLVLPNLPDSFDGFKIVQISDIHTGSFTSSEPLSHAVNIINDQKADIVFCTGDLVNDKHEEVLPYIDILKKIKAKHGVISIFGNHDYGDYIHWENAEAKQNNIQKLKEIHIQLGWKLLWDEHCNIEQNGECITIIGVQNCSTHGFSNYGSMKKATENINYSTVNILLSHDPSHWKKEVTTKYSNINLTLSGHTHGMQFGIDIPGFKWSPIQYLYKEWADLYQENNQYLYVNRGLGFIGYPGRVGILPEITVIELRKIDDEKIKSQSGHISS